MAQNVGALFLCSLCVEGCLWRNDGIIIWTTSLFSVIAFNVIIVSKSLCFFVIVIIIIIVIILIISGIFIVSLPKCDPPP